MTTKVRRCPSDHPLGQHIHGTIYPEIVDSDGNNILYDCGHAGHAVIPEQYSHWTKPIPLRLIVFVAGADITSHRFLCPDC